MPENTIKLRAKEEEGAITVKALITHEMETGARKDAKTGEIVPAHYIQEVVCEVAGKTVMTAYWSGGVSKNPYLSFKLKGAKPGEDIKLTWKDNKGEGDTVTAKIG
jgi:sulfur-oxidizing protein SoxZ